MQNLGEVSKGDCQRERENKISGHSSALIHCKSDPFPIKLLKALSKSNMLFIIYPMTSCHVPFNRKLSAKEQFTFLKLFTFITLPKMKHIVLGTLVKSLDLLIRLKLDISSLRKYNYFKIWQ